MHTPIIYLRAKVVPAFVLMLSVASNIYAQTPTALPADTLQEQTIDEALVVASPKEHALFRRQPLSATLLDAEAINLSGASNMKGLSTIVPNFYMPAYGSRLTGSIYVRGIGSRVNSSSVAMYVDDVAQADKSMFDFSFLDVERVDVLRGPQGSLYGRGAMSGLVRVSTADPFRSYGTRLRLSATGRNAGRAAQAIHYFHPASNLALSLAAFYEGDSGFERNRTLNHKAEGGDAFGGRFKAALKATDALRLDFSANYEHSRERSNPYIYLGATDPAAEQYPDLIGIISQNRQSHYRRDMLQSSLKATLQRRHFTLTSITAYQYLRDNLFMDQDFLRADIFSLNQRQRLHNVSEEISLKGNVKGRWEWTTGAFGTWGRKQVTCPVNFYADGVDYLNNNFARVLPSFINVRFTDTALPFDARLKNADANLALFHQSTLRNLFISGLSLTLGLRLDYDYHRLALRSSDTSYQYEFGVQMPAFGLNIQHPFASDALLSGRNSHHHLQLLPKVALQYDLPNNRGNLYGSVSKGYRSGGYNLENYSDLSQNILRRNMMLQVQDYSQQTISALPGLPDESKQAAIAGMNAVISQNIPAKSTVDELAFKPEYSWNHEIGAHLNFFNGALEADICAFWLSTHHLQLSRFAANGYGRETVNAGRASTLGTEISLCAYLLSRRLSLSAAYGYAHSEFTRYELGNNGTSDVDYRGNTVPYAPRHTLGLQAAFTQPLLTSWLKAVGIGANLRAAGPIYWDEANTLRSRFNAQLDLQATLSLAHDITLTLFANNLTDSHYATFEFVSMQRLFYQSGTPRHFGLSLSLAF